MHSSVTQPSPVRHDTPAVTQHCGHIDPAATTAPPAAGSLRFRARQLLLLSRPRQWTKNILVLAAPAAAGALDQDVVWQAAALAIVAFVAASGAVYAVNDVVDAPADRAHPTKGRRPVAAGTISPRLALAWATICALTALGAAAAAGPATAAVVAGYLALSLSYARWLKHQPVLDIVAVAGGFVLRALGGAAATQVVPSNWFLLVSLFGALYIVTGKRAGEARRPHPADARETRPVLARYPHAWLEQVLTVALTGTALSYAMWAFQDVGTDVFKPVLAVSVVPFLIALLRYGLLLARGHGEEPERLAATDAPLFAAGLVWVATLAVGLYGA